MKMTKINRQKIYEVIAEQIKQQIMNGDLKPGDRLPTGKELCEMYQVGRSTVREALSALEIMGLIETRQGEGSTVKTWKAENMEFPNLQDFLISEETVLELMEARKSLEISISRMAAVKRTEEDLKKLEANLKSMEQNLTNANESKRIDMLFHKILARSTHNSIMVHLLETISDQMDKAMEEIRRITFGSPSLSERILKEHRSIYEAVVDQDLTLAQQKMLDHLGHFESEMIEYYKSKREKREMEKR
jgi:GntR family transcriptional regulator, transcriptional repressor for pyruvate dehydrogenase complex